MEKKRFFLGILAGLLVLGFVLTGCVSTKGVGAGPVPTAEAQRTGQASSFALFGLFFWGDASVVAAKRAGEIQEVSTIDHRVLNILGGGLFQKTTVIVTGR